MSTATKTITLSTISPTPTTSNLLPKISTTTAGDFISTEHAHIMIVYI